MTAAKNKPKIRFEKFIEAFSKGNFNHQCEPHWIIKERLKLDSAFSMLERKIKRGEQDVELQYHGALID